VDTTIRQYEPSLGNRLESNRLEADRKISGSIFSFLPAHGESRAGAVAKQLSRTLTEGLGVTVLLADFDRRGYPLWRASESPRRLDGRTWGAFVSESEGMSVLDAREVHPRQLRGVLDYAREHYHIVCADLTDAKDVHALEVLRASDGIFLVSGSDPASIEGVREKTDWLRSIDLSEQSALLLRRSANGAGAREMEDLTGLPVCSLIETAEQVSHLATWLAADTVARSAGDQQALEPQQFALAG
jgi:Flp pilus assembly CpaE family ATPase